MISLHLISLFLSQLASTKTPKDAIVQINEISKAESDIILDRRFQRIDLLTRRNLSSVSVGVPPKQRIVDNDLTRDHFRIPQTNKTPFLIEPLLSHFGHGAETSAVRAFMSDLLHPISQNTPSILRQILNLIWSSTSDGCHASITLSLEDIKSGHAIWLDKALTSTDGCHLGHHKAWLSSEFFEKDDQPPPPISKGHFFYIIRPKLTAAIQLQHPPSRWHRVHMMYTPKDPRNHPPITRLPMLNQLDSKLNLLRRILISQSVMQISEMHKLLAPE